MARMPKTARSRQCRDHAADVRKLIDSGELANGHLPRRMPELDDCECGATPMMDVYRYWATS